MDISIDLVEVEGALMPLATRISAGKVTDGLLDRVFDLLEHHPFELVVIPSSTAAEARDQVVRFAVTGISEFCAAAVAALRDNCFVHD